MLKASNRALYYISLACLVLFIVMLFNPILISILYPNLDSFIESDKYIIIHKTFFVWAIPTFLSQVIIIYVFKPFTLACLQRFNLEMQIKNNIKTQINDLLLIMIAGLCIQYIGYLWSLLMVGLTVPMPYSKKLILIAIWVGSIPLLYPLVQFLRFRQYLKDNLIKS